MKPCYIFDIDGTLADGTHRIHHLAETPKNWDAYFAKCDADTAHTHVVELCRRLYRYADIVYVSGRMELS